jgi:protein ImuB
MLWLAIHFPSLALEIYPQESTRPVAVISSGNPVVIACNAAAEALGIVPGMIESAAHALAGNLQTHPRNPAAESAALQELATWAMQFTPSVSLVQRDGLIPENGLVLEIGGSLKLFKGLLPILMQARTELDEMHHRACITVAPTPLAASLFARAGVAVQITELEKLEKPFADLPIALLDCSQNELETFDSIGVRSIGDCLKLPRDGLAKRFGRPVLDTLDRALGKIPDARKFFTPPPRFESALELPAPVQETGALLFAAKRLVLSLSGFLRGQGGGVQHFDLSLLHEDIPSTNIRIGLVAANRDSQHLIEILRERLDRVELPAPVQEIRLCADAIQPLQSRNLALFYDGTENGENWHLLVEKLRARLGSEAVHGIHSVQDHRPERAWRSGPPGEESNSQIAGQRPCWLLTQPRPLPSRAGRPYLDGPVTIAQGPERIEGGWWDDYPVARDYYLAQTVTGARIWIFRELRRKEAWYLHGIVG